MTVHTRAADDTSLLAPGVVFPPVSVATNENGVLVHRFSMTPVLTNTATATNDLALLRQQLVKIDDEIKQVLARQNPLKPVMNQDYRAMATFPTNYVPQDEEGKKIKARVTELETELNDLRGQLDKRMADDPAYKEAKSKVDAHKQEWLAIEKRKDELRKERIDVGGKIWQLQKLTEEAEKFAEAKRKKTVTGEAAP